MSAIEALDGREDLTQAARLAIARAKRRGSEEVMPDDLLAGLLLVIARFGIALVGRHAIDLEALGEVGPSEVEAADIKVAYSSAAAALFDRAAAIAKEERSLKVAPVHMLAAFARVEDGLMGRIKAAYGFDSAGWRTALARRQLEEERRHVAAGARSPAIVQDLLSPDEAADFLGVHTQTIRGYIRSGKLSAHRVAGERALRIRRQDLIDLLEPYELD